MSIYLVILVQATLAEYIRIYGVKPNILLVFIISVALLRGNVEGAVVGFFTGLSQDMLSGKILGFYSLLGLYLGTIIGSVNKRLYRDNFAVIVFFTFISTVIYEWLVYFLNTFMRNQIDLIYPFTHVILPEAIYNSVISILVYAVVLRLDMRLEGISKITRKY
jgi:rod shape-determining protein MreD